MFAFLLALLCTQIELGGHLLEVEVAKTTEEKARGLMGRPSLAEDQGMLFMYEKPQILSFWMKNTQIPLSIGFFDEEGRLVQVEEMAVIPEGQKAVPPQYRSRLPAKYALEMPALWFDRHKVKSGVVLKIHRH